MKNLKTTKIAILALSLALLIGLAIGFSVSADSAGSYGIIAMNISYGDTTQVLVAVDTPVENAANVVVTYTYGGTTYAAKYYDKDTYTEEGVEYPIFYTKGISAKDVGEDIFAEAHHKDAVDYTPSYVNVSVAEYLYSMLYREGYIAATDEVAVHKKELYQALLTYAAKAQTSLWNDKKGESEQRVLVTDRPYVYAKDAKINGGAADILLDEAGKVTLTYTGSTAGVVGWTVATYDATGKKTEKVVTGDTIEITESCILTPYVDPYLLTFDDITIGSYAAGNNFGGDIFRVNSATVDIVKKDNGSPAAKFDSGEYVWLYPATSTEEGQTANATVIEMDLDFSSFSSATSVYFRDSKGNISSGGNAYSRLDFNGNRIRFYKDNAAIKFNPDDASTYYDMGTTTGTEFRLKIEYIWSVTEGETTVGKMNIYIDGTKLYSVSVDVVDGCQRLQLVNGTNVFTLDNLKCINTYVEYENN